MFLYKNTTSRPKYALVVHVLVHRDHLVKGEGCRSLQSEQYYLLKSQLWKWSPMEFRYGPDKRASLVRIRGSTDEDMSERVGILSAR